MVMSGSCDLESFRALRILRKRFEADMHFGFNQAIGLAFGLLFLSNGQFTLSRSEKAIAGLLSAVYPIFPQSAYDNRFHLQALRHFYVFALETRLLQARDIDSGAFLNIEATVEMINNGERSTVEVKTPAVINGQILSISVHSNPKYHDLFMHVSDNDPDSQMEVDERAMPQLH
jgi:anaphase-promoting complex subunit 1